MRRPPLLDQAALDAWCDAHREWTLTHGHLVRVVRLATHRAAADVVVAQVAIADRLDHHAVVTLIDREVRIELWTHDRGGITELDLAFASDFDQVLAALSPPADPTTPSTW